MPSTALVKGRIGVLNGNSANDLQFQFNPTEIDRERNASYAPNQAAYADFPNAGPNSVAAQEWLRNEPEQFNVELIFHEVGDKTVDAQLQKLDDLMAPDPTTGRPRDLVLVMGKRSDRVRITNKRVREKLFDPQLGVQSAVVSLRMFALKSRSA